jgi:archaellum component FlaF (FlaF/FlaG flagellin family)
LVLLSGCGAAISSDQAEQQADENVGESQQELTVGSCNVNVEPLRSVEIVHPNIVDDVRASNGFDGAWSFRRMIENMAPSSASADTDALLRSVFESWLTPQFVNGELLEARPAVQGVLFDQFAIPNTAPRQFNLAKAPFRLLAVANRLDLRSATQGGEGRLVYGVTFNDSNGVFQGFFTFTLIIEFALPLKAPLDTPAKWAAKWHELDSLDPATQSTAFANKLQEITDAFTVRNAFVGRPNGSAVNQIRTNEIALSQPWQLREFNMTAAGLMAPATTKQSPNHDLLNDSSQLRDFINQNPVLNATNDTSFFNLKMPTTFEGLLFTGGKANQLTFPNRTDSARWELSPTETQDTSVAIDNFGLLTCNGCHTENKKSTDIQFYNVSPTTATANRITGVNDGTGKLSDFMLLGDPAKGGRRPAELTRRASDMGVLLCAPSGVDYQVQKLSWSPANPAPGQAVTFSATISNQGTASKPAGVINGVGFRVDGNLVTWSDNNTAALAPGQSITVTANSGPSGSATWSAGSGAHSVEAWLDDVNRVGETDENNNKLSSRVAFGVDLTVTNISWDPPVPQSSQPVTFSATIKNNGTVATAGGIQHGVRFEIDGQLVSWSDNSTTSLAPGATRTVTANFGPNGVATWPAVSGKHSIAAWVDDVNRLPDVDRSNNKLQTQLQAF